MVYRGGWLCATSMQRTLRSLVWFRGIRSSEGGRIGSGIRSCFARWQQDRAAEGLECTAQCLQGLAAGQGLDVPRVMSGFVCMQGGGMPPTGQLVGSGLEGLIAHKVHLVVVIAHLWGAGVVQEEEGFGGECKLWRLWAVIWGPMWQQHAEAPHRVRQKSPEAKHNWQVAAAAMQVLKSPCRPHPTAHIPPLTPPLRPPPARKDSSSACDRAGTMSLLTRAAIWSKSVV